MNLSQKKKKKKKKKNQNIDQCPFKIFHPTRVMVNGAKVCNGSHFLIFDFNEWEMKVKSMFLCK